MSQGRGAGHEGCDGSEMILSSATQCDVWTMARGAKDYWMPASRGKDGRHVKKPAQRPCAERSPECSRNSILGIGLKDGILMVTAGYGL